MVYDTDHSSALRHAGYYNRYYPGCGQNRGVSRRRILFTAGSGFLLPKSGMGFLTKILESGGTLTIQLYLCMSKAQYGEAFGIAVVLLVLVLLINMLTKYLSGKFNVETRE